MSKRIKTLYFAGGCFWGPQAAFELIKGVENTEVGYAQSSVENPSYEKVCSGTTGAAETVKVEFDENKISLKEILKDFFEMIDPTTKNRQGPDYGKQYRTGIYSNDDKDLQLVKQYIRNEQQPKFKQKIVVEVERLKNFYPAESYHQDFLKKNPDRHCNVDLSLFRK